MERRGPAPGRPSSSFKGWTKNETCFQLCLILSMSALPAFTADPVCAPSHHTVPPSGPGFRPGWSCTSIHKH